MLWRAIMFTGMAPFLLFSALYLAYPMPDLNGYVVFSFLFMVVWTGKNIYYRSKQPQISVDFYGVFFGMYPPHKRKQETVGKWVGSDGHVLVVGGAGTGKSASIAIPTLKYFWNQPFLAVDIKGELAQKSNRSGYIFNPCDPDAYGYDPFYHVRESGNPSAAIREIAITIVPEAPEVKDPFWIRSAQNILTGYMLASFKENQSFIETLQQIQGEPPEVIIKLAATDKQANMFVSQYLGVKRETLGGIMSELANHIIPFIGDPDIEDCLNKQEIITPELLEEGENIFLQIPEHRINQWKALITLIIQQFLSHFERRSEGNNNPILFLLDEFPRFGKMEGILNGLATLRSKKITICLIIQSLAQLDAIYGQDQRKIIADNCSYKAVLGATDADTQQYFSRLVGTQLQQQESFTKDKKHIFINPVVSSTTSMVERAIIKPEEFAYLRDVIVLLQPNGFFLIEKVWHDTISGIEPLA